MDQNKVKRRSGYLAVETLKEKGIIPSCERQKAGPVAVIECVEEIPCNPCEGACRSGCIRIGDKINSLPELDCDRCTGCGVCVACCPGLAIFIEDSSIGNGEALVSFPYEYYPLPVKGEVRSCVNRCGETVCKGTVERVLLSSKNDQTAVITVKIPLEHVHDVRSLERSAGNVK